MTYFQAQTAVWGRIALNGCPATAATALRPPNNNRKRGKGHPLSILFASTPFPYEILKFHSIRTSFNPLFKKQTKTKCQEDSRIAVIVVTIF
jgi:hypothetical protein